MAFIILPGTHPGTDDIRYDIGDENAGSGNYDYVMGRLGLTARF